MKKINEDIKSNKSDNGVYINVETLETTPEDGFVNQNTIRKANPDTYGKYYKGYSKTAVFTTDDPKITRPLVYSLCGLFFLIGLIMLLFRNWFFGIIFIFTSLFSYFKSKKDIDKIEEEYKKQGKKVKFDSKEEKEEYIKEASDKLKNEIDDIKKYTFTKEHYKYFLKQSLPIYIVISIVISIICFIINIILGLFITFISIFVGVLYYYFLSKICKY